MRNLKSGLNNCFLEKILNLELMNFWILTDFFHSKNLLDLICRYTGFYPYYAKAVTLRHLLPCLFVYFDPTKSLGGFSRIPETS